MTNADQRIKEILSTAFSGLPPLREQKHRTLSRYEKAKRQALAVVQSSLRWVIDRAERCCTQVEAAIEDMDFERIQIPRHTGETVAFRRYVLPGLDSLHTLAVDDDQCRHTHVKSILPNESGSLFECSACGMRRMRASDYIEERIARNAN